MARGYPTPKVRDDPAPRLLPDDLCAICKRRPARAGDHKCAECARALGAG